MNKIVIKYRARQVSTNKTSLTEMNHQIRTIETPDNQTTHNQTTQSKDTNIRKKIKSRKSKENYERGKDYLIITKKHRME